MDNLGCLVGDRSRRISRGNFQWGKLDETKEKRNRYEFTERKRWIDLFAWFNVQTSTTLRVIKRN